MVYSSIFCPIDSWCIKRRYDASRLGLLRGYIAYHIILHHGIDDLKRNNPHEEIADNILHLAASVKTTENQVFISDLVVINLFLKKTFLKLKSPFIIAVTTVLRGELLKENT